MDSSGLMLRWSQLQGQASVQWCDCLPAFSTVLFTRVYRGIMESPDYGRYVMFYVAAGQTDITASRSTVNP
jgi:hypothetical protein